MRLVAAGKLSGYAVRIHGPEATGQVVTVAGKRVYFDFDERFGPLVVHPSGEPMARQPIREDHPFWAPFQVWLDGYWKAKGGGGLDAYLDANHGTGRYSRAAKVSSQHLRAKASTKARSRRSP